MIYRGVLAIVVLLVVLLGVFFITDSMPAGLRKYLGWAPVEPAAAPVAAAPAKDKTGPKPKAEYQAHQTMSHEAAAQVQAQPKRAQSRQLSSLPNEADLLPGTPREEVLQKFGQPDYTAKWSRGGTLNEKYIYGQGETATSIMLQNGKVISSRTEPQSL
jgi:hypothetical protein